MSTVKCESCDGTGQVTIVLKARSVGISTLALGGMGKVHCHRCGGTGQFNEHDFVDTGNRDRQCRACGAIDCSTMGEWWCGGRK
jgi:hypothetical protein